MQERGMGGGRGSAAAGKRVAGTKEAVVVEGGHTPTEGRRSRSWGIETGKGLRNEELRRAWRAESLKKS